MSLLRNTNSFCRIIRIVHDRHICTTAMVILQWKQQFDKQTGFILENVSSLINESYPSFPENKHNPLIMPGKVKKKCATMNTYM